MDGETPFSRGMNSATLAINADDYGYAPSYDAGLTAAAEAGVIDGVSLMVMRRPDPTGLVATGIALGLHLEPWPSSAEQAAEFERLIGRPPAYIDGHHHCHATPSMAAEVAALGARLDVAVRSVDGPHRRLLRGLGVATADRLLGRLDESEPRLPAELAAWLAGHEPLSGVTEWFVHPGHPDPFSGSSYDAGRSEDLALLLELGDRRRWAGRGIRRASLARALSA